VTVIPKTRRVVRIDQFGGTEQLQLHTESMPSPGPAELLVRIGAVGVNFADTMVRRGEYRRDQVLPHVPGMEAAGTVVLAGCDAIIPPGTRVALFLESGGGYADYAVVPESLAFAINSHLDDTTVAASFLQGVTAWYALHHYGHVQPGHKVLVTGVAGGLGSWTAQLASDAGAEVVGLASTAAKREMALKHGCSHALDPADNELRPRLREVAPSGFNIIVDGVGGPLFSELLPALAKSGCFVVAGSATQQPAMLDVRHLLPRGQSIVGFVVRNVIDLFPEREPSAALHEVLERVSNGRVSVPVTTFPLEEAARSHLALERRTAIGKLVLTP
jgi:NADPH2:quinone reductase